jgi:hypothetical protein
MAASSRNLANYAQFCDDAQAACIPQNPVNVNEARRFMLAMMAKTRCG